MVTAGEVYRASAAEDLTVSLDRVGNVRQDQGDLAGYEEAVEWFERLASIYGEPHATHQELTTVRSKLTALDHVAASDPSSP